MGVAVFGPDFGAAARGNLIRLKVEFKGGYNIPWASTEFMDID
jgi:hypothetical protein